MSEVSRNETSTGLGARVKLWLLETRAPFLTAALIPVLLGTAIAWGVAGVFHWGYFLLALIGGLCLQAAVNVLNDYFDHKSTCDDINVEYISPLTGGSRMIQMGLLKPSTVLMEGLIFLAIGSLIGLYLVWSRGLPVLWLGMIGIFFVYFYTAPPLKLSYRGGGELAVGLSFGILMCLGAYYVQTQVLAWFPVIAAIPVTLLIAAVLYINEFPDYAADKAVGRKHLVVRMGKARAVKGYIVLMSLAYFSIVVSTIYGQLWGVSSALPLSLFTLLGLLTLPQAIKAMRITKEYYADSASLTPANAYTIQIHLRTGLLLTAAFLLAGVVSFIV